MKQTVIEELGDAGTWEKLSPTVSTGVTEAIRKPKYGPHRGMEAKALLLEVENYPVRMKLNGEAPTATDGILINAGQNYTVIGISNVQHFRCIDTASGASAVHITPFF